MNLHLYDRFNDDQSVMSIAEAPPMQIVMLLHLYGASSETRIARMLMEEGHADDFKKILNMPRLDKALYVNYAEKIPQITSNLHLDGLIEIVSTARWRVDYRYKLTDKGGEMVHSFKKELRRLSVAVQHAGADSMTQALFSPRSLQGGAG